MVGNFPQAFSHVALVGTALTLAKAMGHPAAGLHPDLRTSTGAGVPAEV